VRDLPLQCRRVFLLRKVYDLSYQEIAKRLEISVSTVEKHMLNGVTKCSAYLRAHGEDPSQMYEREDEEDSKLALLREGLSGLDERSRDIVKRRWLDDDSKITLQELADEYGVSAERIRQIEVAAMKKMKTALAAYA